MNPGKNRCEYLKEVRRRIAHENGIPLEQRKCTYQGECSGTCPFCEAELHYLEKELNKRKSLGKAVTVAGIALSSLMIGACETSSHYTSFGGTIGYAPPSFVTEADSTDPTAMRSEYESCFVQIRGNTGSNVLIKDGVRIRYVGSDIWPAVFPTEHGSPVQWLSQRLRSYSTYMNNELLNETMITFVINTDGTISDVELINMPETGSEEDFNFQNEVRKQVTMMPRWQPATKDDAPVPYPVAIAISDLRH